MELQALTKGELLGYPLDAIPPSRDSSLETLVLPPSPRDNDNDDDEVRAHARARAHLGSANGRTYSLTRAGPQVHEAVLGELLDSQADWPSHPRCTARPPHAHRRVPQLLLRMPSMPSTRLFNTLDRQYLGTKQRLLQAYLQY